MVYAFTYIYYIPYTIYHLNRLYRESPVNITHNLSTHRVSDTIPVC